MDGNRHSVVSVLTRMARLPPCIVQVLASPICLPAPVGKEQRVQTVYDRPLAWVAAAQRITALRCYVGTMGIKEAVASAVAFAEQSLGPDRTAGIRLEEIETSVVGGEGVWLIKLSNIQIPFPVLGFPSPVPGFYSSRFAALTVGADTTRDYKVYAVSKETGVVLSMKIRLLSAPAA